MNTIKFTSIIITVILVIFSCADNNLEGKNKKQVKIENNSEINSKIETDSIKNNYDNKENFEDEHFDYSNIIINSTFIDTLKVNFSNKINKDLFIFTMPKGNITKTKSSIKIFDNSGKLIFEYTFETSCLMNGYDLVGIKNQSELNNYINTKAEEILDLKSFDFSYTNELFEIKDNFENYNVFLECKKEKLPLFTFYLSEENSHTIGYSTKMKKVFNIYSCC